MSARITKKRESRYERTAVAAVPAPQSETAQVKIPGKQTEEGRGAEAGAADRFVSAWAAEPRPPAIFNFG